MLKGLTVNPALAATFSSTDISGTPGNGTINTPSGRFAIAAAASAATITSSIVTAASKVQCQVETNDGTLKSVSVLPGAGSFVVTGNAAATGITVINVIVTN
jgi:VCBS repeat-containing protein